MNNNLIVLSNMQEYFKSRLDRLALNCSPESKSYIIGLLSRPLDEFGSRQSVTLVYAKKNFESYQKVGDWILLSKSIYPDSLTGASSEYYDSLAQISYFKCFILLNKRWKIFEELADIFPNLTLELRKLF